MTSKYLKYSLKYVPAKFYSAKLINLEYHIFWQTTQILFDTLSKGKLLGHRKPLGFAIQIIEIAFKIYPKITLKCSFLVCQGYLGIDLFYSAWWIYKTLVKQTTYYRPIPVVYVRYAVDDFMSQMMESDWVMHARLSALVIMADRLQHPS